MRIQGKGGGLTANGMFIIAEDGLAWYDIDKNESVHFLSWER